MKLKVKILEEDSIYRLKDAINNDLKYYNEKEIVDIKYSGNGGTAPYGTKKYSAMIIYRINDAW
ncbi:sporulation protein Cse60 [Peptostreptococcus porci]|uniref:sporulation protein Cse60 n=1 Tax=Peptostreptococcus porci TaxID=2652282 RepID=UPI002A80E9C7|nr:sporulation protein Cse60 [Peptostreptococcus porci]MDY4127709.1 sporulation protein Cse60 [Peptostreptococcus porci]